MTTLSLRGRLSQIPVLPVLVVAGTSLIIFLVLNPWLIFSATTPTGGDMGAHVFGPAYLRDNLLPVGRVLGWSNDWFAGFPAFYFYFPLPSLTIVALDVFLPYGVAFKIVTVLGLLALPPSIYFHARAMTLGRHVSLIAAGTAAVFAFLESYSIYGGNIASTLAGEFSYSWSFSLALVYLGLLMKAVRDDRRYTKWAALALALTALSHVLTTLVVIFASLLVLAVELEAGHLGGAPDDRVPVGVDVVAVPVEPLNAMVPGIGKDESVLIVENHSVRIIEFPERGTLFAPLGDKPRRLLTRCRCVRQECARADQQCQAAEAPHR